MATTHLHPAKSHADGGRRALLTLADLVGLLLLRRVVAVLPGSHLQIQHARHGVAPRQVLEEDEFFKEEVKDHSKDREKDKDWYEDVCKHSAWWLSSGRILY